MFSIIDIVKSFIKNMPNYDYKFVPISLSNYQPSILILVAISVSFTKPTISWRMQIFMMDYIIKLNISMSLSMEAKKCTYILDP